MEFREFVVAVRGGWWLAAMGLVVGGVAGLVLSLVSTPLYTSQTELFVSTNDSTSTSDVFAG